MRTHLHVDEVQPVTARASAREDQRLDYELPPLKLRPPWLIFLAKHFAPTSRNGARRRSAEPSRAFAASCT
jgi:hypothetical protein